MMTKEEFANLLNSDKETEHIEFKTAKKSFNFENDRHSVCGYCVALANERGGKLVLGVSDKLPRKLIGTKAFSDVDKLEKDIFNFWKRRVLIEEYFENGKRALIIDVPSRPIGEPLQFKGQYLMRVKDSLESMTPEQLKKIINESIIDYSAEIINKAKWDDLSQKAINEMRKLIKQSGRSDIDVNKLDDEQLLRDLRLVQGKGGITLAALVLLGKNDSLKKFLPYAEIRFGYKTSISEVRNQDAEIYSDGYLLFYNKIWQKINSRNNIIHIPQGMLLMDKKTFDEETIREAINNAALHRDYSVNETIFIIQTPNEISIKSPGGFPEGVNLENIINESKPRNKLIADTLYKCDFVEHFGTGVNLMYQKQLSVGKNPPDYSKSTQNRVVLNLDGTIKDMEFAKYVYRVANEKQKMLNDQELIVLSNIKDNKKIKAKQIANSLFELGLVEKVGYGKYLLSKKYYDHANKKGEYTRRKGLDREAKKMLIVEHIRNYKKGYMKDFIEVLKDTPRPTISKYLTELKNERRIELSGNPQAARGENRAFWKLPKNDVDK